MDIIIRSLCKSFGEHIIFENFSASFEESKISIITAASGYGKTTLLRIILGLEEPDSGEIIGVPKEKAAVFQENRLFEDFSAVTNIAAVIPGRADRAWIEKNLYRLGLLEYINSPVKNLSGGMKRRTALARAMLAPAKLVVLDEPFTGLDEETKRLAMDFVKENSKHKTVLLVTHDAMERDYFNAKILSLE